MKCITITGYDASQIGSLEKVCYFEDPNHVGYLSYGGAVHAYFSQSGASGGGSGTDPEAGS